MTNYTKEYGLIIKLLRERKLGKALAQLAPLVTRSGDGRLGDVLSDIEMNHALLMRYFVQNVDDSHRMMIHHNLIVSSAQLLADVVEVLRMSELGVFDYAQMRSWLASEAHRSVEQCERNLRMFAEGLVAREVYERSQSEMYNFLWLSSFYDDRQVAFYERLMRDETFVVADKCLAVSALTMGLLRHFSQAKFNLLFDTCLSGDVDVQMRSLVGLCLVVLRHDVQIRLMPDWQTKCSVLTDNSFLLEKVVRIFLQIIRTSETEAITRKMNDEIIPEILRAQSKVRDKLSQEGGELPTDPAEFNPEWGDLFEESGVGKKMQEMSELQMDGADVYMSTFSSLKNYPFFDESYRWFLKFDKENSAVSSLFEPGAKSILDAFLTSDALCNSDKYSFCLSLKQMPEAQQQGLKGAFNSEVAQIGENRKEGEAPDMYVSNQYVQEMYRYFKLNRRLDRADDVFQRVLVLHRTCLFEHIADKEGVCLRVANYYFAKKHYTQALDLYGACAEGGVVAELCQKIGFCHQQLGHFRAAVENYERADLMSPSNVWTLRRLAQCARRAKRLDDALRYYRQIDVLRPDDKSTQLSVAYCLVELGKVSEAAGVYYKLDIEHPDAVDVWRPLAWCLFLMGHFEGAERYWERVLGSGALVTDFLNVAHNTWMVGKRELALYYYRKCRGLCDSEREFEKMLEADKSYLLDLGVAADEWMLLVDAI